MKKVANFTALLSIIFLFACSKADINDGFTPAEATPKFFATSDDHFSDDEGETATALFTINNDKGKVLENEALLLTNASKNAVSYHWDFGNGDTSNEAQPNYNYKLHGYYNVTLTVTDANGQSHQASQEILVLCIFGGGDHSK